MRELPAVADEETARAMRARYGRELAAAVDDFEASDGDLGELRRIRDRADRAAVQRQEWDPS